MSTKRVPALPWTRITFGGGRCAASVGGPPPIPPILVTQQERWGSNWQVSASAHSKTPCRSPIGIRGNGPMWYGVGHDQGRRASPRGLMKCYRRRSRWCRNVRDRGFANGNRSDRVMGVA